MAWPHPQTAPTLCPLSSPPLANTCGSATAHTTEYDASPMCDDRSAVTFPVIQ